MCDRLASATLPRMTNTGPERDRHRWRRWGIRGAAGLTILLVAIQLVPYGRGHGNPATTREPSWDAPRTRQLFMQACGDCHSNLTRWPWYTNVAPVSWLTQRDVDSGRAAFDISNWDRPQDVSAGDMAETIRGGSMPPWFYTPLHPAANLSSAEKQALISGLARTFAASPPLGQH
jgi:mono/diheme cytochrome c family protein